MEQCKRRTKAIDILKALGIGISCTLTRVLHPTPLMCAPGCLPKVSTIDFLMYKRKLGAGFQTEFLVKPRIKVTHLDTVYIRQRIHVVTI